MRSLHSLVGLSLLLVGASACAPGQGDVIVESSTSDVEASGLSAQAGSLRVTLQNVARFEQRNGERVLVVTGSANRNLEGVFSFVPDDAFGEASLVTKRKFELVLRDGHEINSLLSGMPILLRVTAATGSTPFVFARIALAPRFARFQGSSALHIDAKIAPVFVRDEVDSLRYRGLVSATSAIDTLSVSTDDDVDPDVSRVDGDTFRFDWPYARFVVTADPHTDPVYFTASMTSGASRSKRAHVDIAVTSLDITTADPYETWPSDASCEEAIYGCIRGKDQVGDPDLGECGSYRDVSRCVNARPDEICLYEGPSPFELSSFDASDELTDAQTAYGEGCSNGGTFCSLGAVQTFNVPACLAEPASLQAALDWLATNDQGFLAGGTRLDRSGLEGSTLFSSSYSTGGPGLLLALDVVAGGGEVEAYIATQEIACHNCTDFADYAVIFYPGSGVVAVLQATHGYDS